MKNTDKQNTAFTTSSSRKRFEKKFYNTNPRSSTGSAFSVQTKWQEKNWNQPLVQIGTSRQ